MLNIIRKSHSSDLFHQIQRLASKKLKRPLKAPSEELSASQRRKKDTLQTIDEQLLPVVSLNCQKQSFG